MRFITRRHIARINRARTALRELERLAQDCGHVAQLDPHSRPSAVDYGRMAEALDRAEDAIFNALNVAHNYAGQELDEEELHNRTQEATPEIEPRSLRAVPDEPHRNPYVGSGADGARRSAQIDRDERDMLAADDLRRPLLEASALRWERQAEDLER